MLRRQRAYGYTIKKEIFKNCKLLESIFAEVGVSPISYCAFEGCENLKEARFHILKNIRDGAFEGCRNLETLKLWLPDKVAWTLSFQRLFFP